MKRNCHSCQDKGYVVKVSGKFAVAKGCKRCELWKSKKVRLQAGAAVKRVEEALAMTVDRDLVADDPTDWGKELDEDRSHRQALAFEHERDRGHTW